MKFTIAVAAILGLAAAVQVKDDSNPEGRNIDGAETWYEQHISGWNGADEDEIMDNIYAKFSKEG
jgi:hypothetical protein